MTTEKPVDAVDAWELAGFAGKLDIAAYLTADQHAAQYRLIVDALLDAQQHSLTGISREELLADVRIRVIAATGSENGDRLTSSECFDLDARMRSLRQWGVVDRWQDKARTESDFVRTRDRYQLTSAAADLHRWLRRTIDDDAIATSAAAFAPAVITDRLAEMLGAISGGDTQRAAQAWAQVRTTLADMAEAAAIWQSRMASALAGAPDEDKMLRLRETLMAYVNVWGSGIDTYSVRIRDSVTRLRDVQTDAWRAIVFAGIDAEAAEETVQALVRIHRDAVETLSAWFSERSGQAQRLRRQVRDVVPPLLRGSRALLATGGKVSRRAELLRIAATVERAATEYDAWRGWCAATGLWSARHLAGRAPEPNDSAARVSFWEAPPVPIEVTLRARGARSARGRPAQVVDRRAARMKARRRAEQQRAERHEAERGLLARSGSSISDWPALQHRAEAELVWELLAGLLRQQPDDGGLRVAYSRDGRLRVTAFAAPPHTPSAVVSTPDGKFACENFRLELERT